METLYALPASFNAGTSVTYYRAPADYPVADGWTLTLHLAGAKRLDVTATQSGSYHQVTLTAEETAKLTRGTYTWVERVSKGSEVYDHATGTVDVGLNLATAGDGDAQTENEVLLALVNARLRGRLTADMEAYTIRGRAISKIPFEQLRKFQTQLETAVAQERNPGTFSRPVSFRFVRPNS